MIRIGDDHIVDTSGGWDLVDLNKSPVNITTISEVNTLFLFKNNIKRTTHLDYRPQLSRISHLSRKRMDGFQNCFPLTVEVSFSNRFKGRNFDLPP